MTCSQRRALITGGSGELGAAICRRLVAAGHFVVIHAHRNTDAAAALAAELNADAVRAGVVSFDVTDAADSRARLEALIAEVAAC